MATGRANQLTKQVGEYLVAAELCRRGLIATTFTGNVPHYDIIAVDAQARHLAVQVKAIRGHSWQFDIRDFVDVRLDGRRQVMGGPVSAAVPGLVCVLVRLGKYGADEFYLLLWEELREVAIAGHREFLARHGGVRPVKHDSFHTAVRLQMVSRFRDRWDLLSARSGDEEPRASRRV